MLPRCGRVAHICEANRTVEWNCNKNLGENHKESQLPSKSEGCNEIQGFRGNCDSQGKLGMCPSLAEPDLGGFPKNYSCNVSCETMLLENHSNPVRQNRFAVCLCAVRRWLRCPNCLWMFLRLQFFWIFYAFRMANSSFFASLRFLLLLIIHSLQGSACPLHPSPSWASSTAVACGSSPSATTKSCPFSAYFKVLMLY